MTSNSVMAHGGGRIEDESLYYFWKGIVSLIDKDKENRELGEAQQTGSGNDEVTRSQSLDAEDFEENRVVGVGDRLEIEGENFVELTLESDNNKWLNDILGDKEMVTLKKNDDGTLHIENAANLSQNKSNADPLQGKETDLVSEGSHACLNCGKEDSPIESYNVDLNQTSSTPDAETSKINTTPKIPTPFKKALFWPEPSTSSTNVKNKKPKLPSVATSDTWREYYRKKEEEKQRLLMEKEGRKRKREEKKEKQIKKRTLQKKSGPKKQQTSKTTADVNKGEQRELEREEDCNCIYCDYLYSESREEDHWIMCQVCQNWAHEECAGVEDEQDEFVCEFCD